MFILGNFAYILNEWSLTLNEETLWTNNNISALDKVRESYFPSSCKI